MLKVPQPSGAGFSIMKDLCPLKAQVYHVMFGVGATKTPSFWSLTCIKLVTLLLFSLHLVKVRI